MCFSVGKRPFMERASITFQGVIVIECFVGATECLKKKKLNRICKPDVDLVMYVNVISIKEGSQSL